MSYIFRVILVVLALAYSTTTLCLFKGHPKYDSQEIMFWVEEKGNKNHMPFYSLSDLEYNGSKGNALLYLYDNGEAEDENVAKVEIAVEVGGEKVVVDFGSCVKPEYRWEYDVSSTEGIIAGDVKRANNYP
ncbi:hypothetical protein V1527DRAFT_522138 [Lipomyces starkeyi]